MSSIVRRFLAVAVLLFAADGCRKPPPPPPPPTPTPSPTPVPTPTPVPWLPKKPLPTAKLFNGLSLFAKVVGKKSSEPASVERKDADSYQVEVTVKARLPRAGVTVEDFKKNDPLLPGTFTDFSGLLAGAEVSPFFEHLYKLKMAQVEREVGRLDVILSRHNFFDCETILSLGNPSTGRRALLAVGDMDVNSDGSDGDRNVTVDGSSPYFLPQTSYRWPKATERENRFLAVEESRLASLKQELAAGGATAARKAEIEEGIDLAKRRIYDLKKWSFLVSEVDPFIVLPGFMMRDKDDPWSPSVGDFALVLFNGKAYPAVVGDAGPSLQIGEASLLLCRELNAKTSAISRPVSDLKVTYLVFPGTADKTNAPPDLEAWRVRCEKYASELGGLAIPVHSWPNLVKPWPTPTPEPTPSPSPQGSDVPLPAPPPASPFVVTPPETN
ncbi:MAG: hypothetical protein D4R65_02880 [Verrucomicrobiaceae bacterium]|nr:MAG: hypothetical protein D4R65_02880 [Verrucomicrobiaceae bacterium]